MIKKKLNSLLIYRTIQNDLIKIFNNTNTNTNTNNNRIRNLQ